MSAKRVREKFSRRLDEMYLCLQEGSVQSDEFALKIKRYIRNYGSDDLPAEYITIAENYLPVRKQQAIRVLERMFDDVKSGCMKRKEFTKAVQKCGRYHSKNSEFIKVRSAYVDFLATAAWE
ncbi:MAG: hypothetical protein WC533_03580 [Candidatus Pacearchaeota archaeon]